MVASEGPPLVVVSNRGPLAFKRNDSGDLVPTRGGGGLVAALGPAIADRDATWIATAISDEDREAAAAGPAQLNDMQVHHLSVEPLRYRQYYDEMANGTLWFLHHNLFDLPHQPNIDKHWWEAWHAYVDVNEAFGAAVAEAAPQDAVVLVHDYHLTLLGKFLKTNRPDLKTVHFHHTPFTGRNSMGILPPTVAHTLLEGLAQHDACGFHSPRWADSFELACGDYLGYRPKTFVSAAASAEDELRVVAESDECLAAAATLDELAGDRQLIVRVDRIELSKNLIRGFHAYDDMLRRNPRLRERVTFAAFIYPSRENIPEYLSYRKDVEAVVARINTQWGTPGWQPIELNLEDDFPLSIAALKRFDVLLVNPIRDGLNLVSKEGAILNERNGVLVLSREAGSWTELNEGAVGINPFDIVGTADALVHALDMDASERLARADILRAAATKRTPKDWLNDQLVAAGVTP